MPASPSDKAPEVLRVSYHLGKYVAQLSWFLAYDGPLLCLVKLPNLGDAISTFMGAVVQLVADHPYEFKQK